MARRKTHAEHVAEIAAKNPNVEVLSEIINVNKKVPCHCKICGHKWEPFPSDLKKGRGCPKCAGNKKLTPVEYVEAINAVNPNIEILGEIINGATKVKCHCKICGHEWKARPGNLKNGRGCPKCAGRGNWSHEMHMADINKINPDVEVLGKIIGNRTKVLCRCKVCSHEWMARPYNLKNGRGCPECKKAKIANAKRLSHTEQIALIAKVNPNVEVLGEIINSHTKVLTRCKICGHEWGVTPDDLKHKRGCPRCAKYGFHSHAAGKLYVMVDDLDLPTMMKIGVSVREDRSKQVLNSARRAGVIIPALHVAKTWEGPTKLMMRIEQMMHENYEEWNIKFPAKFDGCTEFFQYTPETAEAFDIIEETLHEIINANKAA